jgi:hypothetical protein
MQRLPTREGVTPDRLRRLREFQLRVRRLPSARRIEPIVPARGPLSGAHAAIMDRLRKLSPELADSLEQALKDLNDPSRLTYLAPAGEAREVLRGTVQRLAPDDEIRKERWFVGIQQGGKTNPSQTERVRYAVQQRGGDFSDVAGAADLVDERIARLGRSVYQRASGGLHTDIQRQDVRKLLGWVFAVLDEVLPE